jgi:hypothetical protein
MFDLWERSGWRRPEDGKVKDVWRVEIRFSGEFLKERAKKDQWQLIDELPQLVTEALISRRLVVAGGDSNKRRRAMHPLWAAALEQSAAPDFLPLGRKFTSKRAELQEKLIRQATGTLRSAAVLGGGEAVEDIAELFDEVRAVAESDGMHDAKVKRANDRYEFVDEAT